MTIDVLEGHVTFEGDLECGLFCFEAVNRELCVVLMVTELRAVLLCYFIIITCCSRSPSERQKPPLSTSPPGPASGGIRSAWRWRRWGWTHGSARLPMQVVQRAGHRCHRPRSPLRHHVLPARRDATARLEAVAPAEAGRNPCQERREEGSGS